MIFYRKIGFNVLEFLVPSTEHGVKDYNTVYYSLLHFICKPF